MLLCKFCSKECKNNNSLRNHERLCKVNPNRQFTPLQDTNFPRVGRIGHNQYTKAERLGMPKPEISEKTREKLKLNSSRIIWTDERRSRHSISMKQAVLANPDSYTSANVCGRIKLEEYNGEKFHGKWELEVAKWLDKNNIKWERKSIKPFNYFWNNSWHLYFPDFYLPEKDVYIEVKGYETDRDRAKWEVVSNLVVIKQSDITAIKENNFVLVTH